MTVISCTQQFPLYWHDSPRLKAPPFMQAENAGGDYTPLMKFKKCRLLSNQKCIKINS